LYTLPGSSILTVGFVKVRVAQTFHTLDSFYTVHCIEWHILALYRMTPPYTVCKLSSVWNFCATHTSPRPKSEEARASVPQWHRRLCTAHPATFNSVLLERCSEFFITFLCAAVIVHIDCTLLHVY